MELWNGLTPAPRIRAERLKDDEKEMDMNLNNIAAKVLRTREFDVFQ
jgi:hypothetical protein